MRIHLRRYIFVLAGALAAGIVYNIYFMWFSLMKYVKKFIREPLNYMKRQNSGDRIQNEKSLLKSYDAFVFYSGSWLLPPDYSIGTYVNI